MIPKISFGNRKLPKSTMIFNLPARVTCPGKTAFCNKSCYALKAERMYSQVLPARQYNFEASRLDTFDLSMHELIQKNKKKIKQVRIHESGDFYNQAYLLKWYRICLNNPGIKFYAYTKSFHLNFAGKPSNLVLIASFDNTTREASRLTYESKRMFFVYSFTLVDRKAPASCIQDCTICNICWTGKNKNITVNQH